MSTHKYPPELFLLNYILHTRTWLVTFNLVPESYSSGPGVSDSSSTDLYL